jgi:hypothetical protein
MNPVPAFPSVADAMAAVQAGLRFLAADATQLSAQAQAEALQIVERANAIVTAARASVLSAFTSGQGYSADADYSPRAWLIHKTRVTKVVAVAHTAWAKRMVTHPQVVAALAAEDLSESYGRTICRWTDKLPEDCRPAADAILLSGPAGLASFLRRRQLGARLGGPSLPLDVGVSRAIPAAIRRAVILRDQHCRFPGGCGQPAAGCEVRHLRHQAHGGPTSVTDWALFCTFHHQVVIHQRGWTVILNPDGTTMAWNKDKTKIIHSHSPPARPG